MVNGWLENVHGFLLPPHCVLCGERGQPPVLDLCAPCAADLPLNENPCRRCALPLAGPATSCGACLSRPTAFERAVVPYRYAYPLDHLVRALKYNGQLSHARILGTLVVEHVERGKLPELLVPVPLHRARYRERGFNQAAELARVMGRALRIPVDDRLCWRQRPTADQTELNAAQRRSNVRGAFSIAAPLRATHLALVDDVLTTGSTVSEVARVLRDAGAETIEVWAVARAL